MEKVIKGAAEKHWKRDLQRAKGGAGVLLNALQNMVRVVAQPAEPGGAAGSPAFVHSDFICVFIDGAIAVTRGISCCLDKAEGRIDELLELLGGDVKESAEEEQAILRLERAVRMVLEAAEEDGPASTPGNRRIGATLRLGLGLPLLNWQDEEDALC